MSIRSVRNVSIRSIRNMSIRSVRNVSIRSFRNVGISSTKHVSITCLLGAYCKNVVFKETVLGITHYWPFVLGINRLSVDTLNRWQITWICCSMNNRNAGDLRRWRRCDVTIMKHTYIYKWNGIIGLDYVLSPIHTYSEFPPKSPHI